MLATTGDCIFDLSNREERRDLSRKLQKSMNLATIPLNYPTRELKNHDGAQKMLGEIPAVVYQTWVSKKLPRRMYKSVTEFVRMNPDIAFYLFDDWDMDSYMATIWGDREIYKVFRDAQFGPMKADIFRYCILYERGGFYFDISKGLSRPIREFVDENSFELITAEGNRHDFDSPPELKKRLLEPERLFVQWGFGFSPRHRLLDMQIRSIEERQGQFRDTVFEFPKLAILQLTGPHAFTKTVWEYLLEDKSRELNQKGIDFEGAGVFSLKGSGGRYRQSANYLFAGPEKILVENPEPGEGLGL